MLRVRRAQGFYRRAVLASYGGRGCVTGLAVPELLRASHIVGWSEEPRERTIPRNGLCLSALHDAAFDRHLISFAPGSLRLVVAGRLKRLGAAQAVVTEEFLRYEGKPLVCPEQFATDEQLLARHHARAIAGGP